MQKRHFPQIPFDTNIFRKEHKVLWLKSEHTPLTQSSKEKKEHVLRESWIYNMW